MAKRAVIIKASMRGARRKGYAISSAARQLQREFLSDFGYRLAPSLTRIFRFFAPHRSGRLERGMKASIRSRGGRIIVEVESTARSDAGYDYLPVTRFGHRSAVIRPKHAQFLRIPTANGVIYRREVKGYKPSKDWAESAFRACEHELDEAAERLGRAVDRSLR